MGWLGLARWIGLQLCRCCLRAQRGAGCGAPPPSLGTGLITALSLTTVLTAVAGLALGVMMSRSTRVREDMLLEAAKVSLVGLASGLV